MSERIYTVTGFIRHFDWGYLWQHFALYHDYPVVFEQEAYTSFGAKRRVVEANPMVTVTAVEPEDKPAFCA